MSQLSEYFEILLVMPHGQDRGSGVRSMTFFRELFLCVLAQLFSYSSSHQPSHMHNTRHRTNNNFNTPLFNHSKPQKCYLYQVIPIWNSLYQNCLKIALPCLHSKNKLKATSWHPNLSNVQNYHPILAMSK